MHKGLALALVGTGALIGYTLRPVTTSAQTAAPFQPFTIGQSIRLYGDFHSGAKSINCKVSGATTEFIGCEAEGERPPHWVNVRFVQDITPLPQR